MQTFSHSTFHHYSIISYCWGFVFGDLCSGVCVWGFRREGLGMSVYVVLGFVVWTIQGSSEMCVAKCSGFKNPSLSNAQNITRLIDATKVPIPQPKH